MTKLRPPISIDAALARIAGQLPGSWAEMASVTGYADRTVRRWGDFDAAVDDIEARDIPMRAACKLDIAYQAAGGIGAPILEAYADLVKVAASEAFACKQQLLVATMDFMTENHEAEQALLEATRPDAGPAEIANAKKQLLDVREDVDQLIAGLAGNQRAPP
ncbi:hypothetical protein DM806_12875 [Sphingobium lactosutens]|uniref:hypothetical protein n=1 Tax=Sphingobium lactosutens TaxID=522773 RepID=UPI0015BF357D|nr:hypothetical protein [Sphingobium lactosutens]NWK96537.1 hypothetical protein [Sphingobium lactosutens]